MKHENPVQCVVGLGNPGPKYAETRHNVGFWFVDELARTHNQTLRSDAKFFGEVGRITSAAGECWLLKPTTFMNHSGRAVSALCRFYRLAPENLLVVHDELDLDPGVARLKKGGGHGGHNGLRDIIGAIGSKEFLRLRLGVGHPGHRDGVVDYVLSRPAKAEQASIEDAIIEAGRHWDDILAGDLQRAMNALHSAT